MLFRQGLSLFASCLSLAHAVNLTGYEYIVIGSGAGGGPLASRLALAGHKTLLIESGDDQGTNDNYTVPAYQAKVTEDANIAWDFFVRHYSNDSRQELDFKLTYDTPDGGEYTGLDPPAGSTIKGVLYPRAGTLGGCTAHNSLITIYPDRDDFQYIANLTGDSSWAPDNMRNYFVKLERNEYLSPGAAGHGHDGWFGIEEASLNLTSDPQLVSLVTGGAYALGNATNTTIDLATLSMDDANADSAERDRTPALYYIPLATTNGTRNGAREFILAVRDAKYLNGSQMYPLDVRMNSTVTKVNFDNSTTPKAIGVEFLDGKALYRASPLSKNAGPGIPGSATASREVIVAGGSYNSPQILKLSGIGPAEELQRFNISVIKDLPGVGTNLQDHYEVSVEGRAPANFSLLNGCTWGFYGEADPCLDIWEADVDGDRGTYASSGVAAGMFFNSSTSPDGNYDIFAFGGPINFRGYFPGYSVNATEEHDWWTWALLKSHPRNRAGTVTLRSADPLDPPDVLFNSFDTGSGDYQSDLEAMYEAVNLARDAFARQSVEIIEILPGPNVTTKEQIQDYTKNNVWGHHCSSTCPIGTDDDPMAVLDSSFRVRGVSGLRVVDASVYPRIPGTFTAVSTYMVAEKAADVILSQIA